MLKIEEVYENTWNHYVKAKKSIEDNRKLYEQRNGAAISDVIPGFSADKLEFGSYAKENYAVLFVDMRESTLRAKREGAENTFLTMHVYLTALIEIVKHYQGNVIDIMGDGIMAFWGGQEARKKNDMVKIKAAQSAGLCGLDMLRVREPVINKIIEKEKLGSPINMGIGVTFGSVIVTKIGIPASYDVKAFGDCVNCASKYSSTTNNQVKVSKEVHELWPKGKEGTIRFSLIPGEEAFFLS